MAAHDISFGRTQVRFTVNHTRGDAPPLSHPASSRTRAAPLNVECELYSFLCACNGAWLADTATAAPAVQLQAGVPHATAI